MVMLQVEILAQLAAFRLACRFDLNGGGRLALVGASGAGKTTLLRSIAGLLRPQGGCIRYGDQLWFDAHSEVCVPAQRRNCGMVFARCALFPQLSALENVAFGLRARGQSRRAVTEKAAQVMDLVGVAALAGRRASSLSSGEAQRVAIARALAIEPDVLLLDEPLSAIDVEQRPPVRAALRSKIQDAGMTAVLVTHEPVEAMLFSETLVVLERGEVVQRGRLADLRERPHSSYVAAFAGVNLYRGLARPLEGGISAVDVNGATLTIAGRWSGPVALVVDPDSVLLSRTRPESSARNCLFGPVTHSMPEGAALRVSLGSVPPIVARVTNPSAAELGIAPGVPIFATFKANEIRVH